MDGSTLGIIIATFCGPVAAVLVTRYVDKLRENEKRQFDVFRVLMRTRRMAISPEHVGALNLVEIEFHKNKEVITALKDLMRHFETAYGASKTVDEIRGANEKAEVLRTALLSAIARALKFNFEQLEILNGGYSPQGWNIELDEQTTIRRGLAAVFKGQHALPITVIQSPGNAVAQVPPQQVSPFPPKP